MRAFSSGRAAGTSTTTCPPIKTAFVVVDMQNYFMARGQQVEIPAAREIVPNINRLADALRKAGGLVVWVRTISNEDSFKNWSHFHDILNTPQRKARRHEAMKEGAFGSKLWPELDVRAEDLIVCKTRYSAFIQGSSSLEAELAQAEASPRSGSAAPRPIPAARAPRATPCYSTSAPP